jgi:arsenite methyltransferase
VNDNVGPNSDGKWYDAAMAETPDDPWKRWLLARRHGGDAARRQAMLDELRPVRDRILANGEFADGQTLLDVGCGDGLVAFAALERTQRSIVWFADISEPLLSHARELATEAGVVDRCRFVRASADDLSGVPADFFDLVTTRSVLIFVGDKGKALAEFHRVLKAGGKISLFEPINRFPVPVPEDLMSAYEGYDVGPVRDLWEKIKALRFPASITSMIDFDERDLVRLAEQAGFTRLTRTLIAYLMSPGQVPLPKSNRSGNAAASK